MTPGVGKPSGRPTRRKTAADSPDSSDGRANGRDHRHHIGGERINEQRRPNPYSRQQRSKLIYTPSRHPAARPMPTTATGIRQSRKVRSGIGRSALRGNTFGVLAKERHIHPPPNPLGNFSTASRWTILPRRGTIFGTARPEPVQTNIMCGRRKCGMTSICLPTSQPTLPRRWAFSTNFWSPLASNLARSSARTSGEMISGSFSSRHREQHSRIVHHQGIRHLDADLGK